MCRSSLLIILVASAIIAVFINADRKVKVSSRRQLIRPDNVQISWYELLRKRHMYIEDASLLYVLRLYTPFTSWEENRELFNWSVNLRVTKPIAFIAPTFFPKPKDPQQRTNLYNNLKQDMQDNFFNFLYICRLQSVGMLKPWWKKFYPKISSPLHHYHRHNSNNSHEAAEESTIDDLFDQMATDVDPMERPIDRSHRVFNFIVTVPAELGALQMIASRLESVSDPAFLFEDFEIEGHEDFDKDFIREHRISCLNTHVALTSDLQMIWRFLLREIDNVAQGICGINVNNSDEMNNINQRDSNESVLGHFEDISVSLLRPIWSNSQDDFKTWMKSHEDSDKNFTKNFNMNKLQPWNLETFKDFTMNAVQRSVSSRYNHTVNYRLYDALFDSYVTEYLLPYMENDFCPTIQQDYFHIHQSNRIVRFQTGFYELGDGQHVEDLHAVVKERVIENPASIDYCLSGVKTSMLIDEKKLRGKYQNCQVVTRTLYFAANGSEEARNEILRRKYHGGSMTSRELGCFIDQTSSQDSFCLPINMDSADYNTLNLMAAVLVSSDKMEQASLPPKLSTDDSISPISAKTLVMGLGGGEFHHTLSKLFPSMYVETIEISRDVVEIAWDTFGLQHLVCEVEYYDYERQVFYSVYQNFQESTKSSLGEDNALFSTDGYTNLLLPDGREYCRSKVRAIDAWKYIELLYNNATATSSIAEAAQFRYDYIIFDIYDEKSTYWDGTLYSGESVPHGFAVIQSFPRLRELLTPGTGIMVTHLHKDANFKRYYHEMISVFGQEQVVLFEVSSNDAIIVAGRDRFKPAVEVDVPIDGVISNRVDGESWNQLLDHPCNEENQAIWPKKMLEFGRNIGLTPRMSMMYLLSLNCHPVESDIDEN